MKPNTIILLAGVAAVGFYLYSTRKPAPQPSSVAGTHPIGSPNTTPSWDEIGRDLADDAASAIGAWLNS